MSVLNLPKMCKIYSILKLYSIAFEKTLAQVTSAKKNMCTCLRALEASIGTINISTRCFDISSVRYMDSTTGQMVPAVLGERLQWGVVALLAIWAQSDRLSNPCIEPSC